MPNKIGGAVRMGWARLTVIGCAVGTALRAWGAYPTHEGAEKTFTDAELTKGLDTYAHDVEELYAPIWEREYGWAQKWMEVMDHPPEKVRARKRAYQARRKRIESLVLR
jgi:hypothetical protein